MIWDLVRRRSIANSGRRFKSPQEGFSVDAVFRPQRNPEKVKEFLANEYLQIEEDLKVLPRDSIHVRSHHSQEKHDLRVCS